MWKYRIFVRVQNFKIMLKYIKVATIGKYSIYRTEENQNKIGNFLNEKGQKTSVPVYYIHARRGNKDLHLVECSIAGEKLTTIDYIDTIKPKLDRYIKDREEKIIREYKYLRKIKSIEPINYKFKNTTITIKTEEAYYFEGSVMDTESKRLIIFIDGYKIHSINQVPVDFEITEGYLREIYLLNYHERKIYHDPIKTDKYKTKLFDSYVIAACNVIGLIWKFKSEKENIAIIKCPSISSHYLDWGIVRFEVKIGDNKHTYKEINIKELQPENIVGKLVDNISILINKSYFVSQ